MTAVSERLRQAAERGQIRRMRFVSLLEPDRPCPKGANNGSGAPTQSPRRRSRADWTESRDQATWRCFD
jgi:hypothetical protein